jgi:hypothetical protein
MKRFSLLIITTFFCIYSNAQDTIVKLNGDKILAKVIEVSQTEIKYKKFDFQDGPTYLEIKSNIRLIIYSDGTKIEIETPQAKNSLKPAENANDYSKGPVDPKNKIAMDGKGYWYHGNWMDKQDMYKLLLDTKDQQITLLVKSAQKDRRLQRMGYTIIPLVLLATIFDANSDNPGPNSQIISATGKALCYSGVIAFSISTIYFKRKQHASNKEAIKLYNERY